MRQPHRKTERAGKSPSRSYLRLYRTYHPLTTIMMMLRIQNFGEESLSVWKFGGAKHLARRRGTKSSSAGQAE